MRSSAWLVVVLSSLAVAQTNAVGTDDPTRGTTVLPGSAAFSDEATSLVYNPAGLGRVGRFNAWYLHERSNTRNLNNHGVWLATSIGDMVGFGVSFQWLNSFSGFSGLAPTGKTSLGFSAGPQQLSAGLAINWFTGGALSGLPSYDLGVQSRPVRWLSLGATVRNVAAQVVPGVTGPNLREWGLAVGLRPFHEYVTLGVDWNAREGRPINESRLQYTLAVHVLGGVRVLGGLSHAFVPSQPFYVHAGLGVDLENFGYTQGVAYSTAGQVNLQFAGRISMDAHASIVPERKIAVLSLGGLGGDAGSTLGSLIGIAEEDRYLRLLRFLERAADDRELEGVVLKIEDAEVGLARADELRSAIVKLRRAGKKVFAYVLHATDVEYLMISACDGIYAAPEAMFLVDGLRSDVTFFGAAAQRYGVDIDVARVGDYKTFPEQFTRADMSDAQRETITAYLDTNARVIAQRVSEARGVTPEAWQAALDEGLKPAKRAVALRQLDGVLTPVQFDELLSERLPGARVDRSYRPWPERNTRWGRQDSIAIIPVLGAISGGKNSVSPLTGVTAGAQSFISALAEAASDPTVKAIVLRVDSPGGDGLASDLMYRAVIEAKKRKPVIASMGDVAASGGYYVAMGADVIVASPTTLTGSIGVFYVKPAVKRLAESFGVTQRSISRGKLAGITDSFEPWTDAQRTAAQGWIDDFYDTFITEAAASRKLPKEALDKIARGRVWSGEDAKANGLVDVNGGLMDAVMLAKERSGLGDDYALDIVESSGGIVSQVLGASIPDALLTMSVEQPALPPGLQSLALQLGAASWILDKPGVQARLEYTLDVR